MSDDHFRYDVLVQNALRGVVRDVLRDVESNGLPGEHHFYIGFKTTAPGVKISNRLLDKYPEEMTIVLQHQFWDLQVREKEFQIQLSFDNVPEKIQIPFVALTGFMDPTTQFGLQFDASAISSMLEDSDKETDAPSLVPAVKAQDDEPINSDEEALDAAEKVRDNAKPDDAADDDDETGDAEQVTGEVVQLDAFRQKN